MFWIIAGINAVLIWSLIFYRPMFLKVFDFFMSTYTFFRLRYKKHDPFKPVLLIHSVSCFVDCFDNQVTSRKGKPKCFRSDSMDALLKQVKEYEAAKETTISLKPIALRLNYSFSEWNQSFMKLIDLSEEDPEESMVNLLKRAYNSAKPDFCDMNYDYSVSLTSHSFPENDPRIRMMEYNLEAYIRRSSTFEAEQTLKLLSERPETLEFIYKVEWEPGTLKYSVTDDLDNKFCICV